EVDVAARGVDQMVASDSREVAIAGIDDDVQLRISQLQAGGEGNGASVRGVERIELHIARDASGTANARDQSQRSEVDLRVDQSASERVDRRADAASRAPDVWHALAAQELLDRVDDRGNLEIHQIGREIIVAVVAHRAASTIAFRISSGL